MTKDVSENYPGHLTAERKFKGSILRAWLFYILNPFVFFSPLSRYISSFEIWIIFARSYFDRFCIKKKYRTYLLVRVTVNCLLLL